MITLGVDPHPGSHTVAALDPNGATLASITVSNWTCPPFWHNELRLKIHRMENLSHGVITAKVYEGV
jgi:hypothetical protein